MAQTRSYKLYLPKEAATELTRHVNKDLSDEERRELAASDSPHSEVEEYIFQEYIMSRRNLAEEVAGSTSVEVTPSGEIIPQ